MSDHVDEQNIEKFVRALKIALVVAVAGAAVYGVKHFADQRYEARAMEAYAALLEADTMEEKAVKETEILSKDAAQVMIQWPADKKDAYVSALRKVVEAHADSTAATMASLRLGRWHFLNSQYSEAAKVYADLGARLGNGDDEVLFKGMALEGQVLSLEEDGKGEEALKTLDAALKTSDNPLKPLAYISKARLLRKAGKNDEAKAAYQSVIKDFPNSVYEKKARALLEREV